MTRYIGNEGQVSLGGSIVASIVDFNINEAASDVDTTACGDPAMTHAMDIPSWDGTIKMNHEHDGQAHELRAGASLAFIGYTQGNQSGRIMLSGTVSITAVGMQVTRGSVVTQEYTIKGNGALTKATV